jgi:predicted RNA-binding protein with PIN domain
MRWLIDGYNVMHAGGRLGTKLGRDGFKRARRRFLDELSAALGPDAAGRTTVVFDASVHPGDFKLEANYRGLGILFALGDENADARIEQLIAGDSNPKTLTVVSSDRRIRQAGARRRSRCLTAEQYWELIDDFKERRGRELKAETSSEAVASEQEESMTAAESALWLEAFRDVALAPGVNDSLAPDDSVLTDADIAEIEREIDREQGGGRRP